MRIIRKILGFCIQSIGLLILGPCFLLITVGGWLVDVGDTLRLYGEE